MSISAHQNLDSARIERLRGLARQGQTIAEMVHDLRSSLGPVPGFTVTMLRYFKTAFNLTLAEARVIEGAACMGNEALSDDELDSILRPLILERLPPPSGG
jgi:hypothetical protein